MNQNLKNLVIILICLILIAGVLYWTMAKQTIKNGHSPLGQSAEITLALGETDEALDLQITFEAVLGDSRCPIDVTCIQAGEFRGRFTFRTPTGKIMAQELRSPGGPGTEEVIDQYLLAIDEVEPSALSTRPIKPEDYKIRIALRRQN